MLLVFALGLLNNACHFYCCTESINHEHGKNGENYFRVQGVNTINEDSDNSLLLFSKQTSAPNFAAN